MCSNILHVIHVKEIGRSFLGLALLPFLKSGVTLA